MDVLALIQAVKDRCPGSVLSSHAWRGDATVAIKKDALAKLAKDLRDDPALRMDFLMDLSAVDYSTYGKKPSPAAFDPSGVAVRPPAEMPDQEPWPGPPGARFAVVYHFFSLEHGHRLRLLVPLEEGGAVESLTPLWAGADWLEREVWDMFGIRFKGHPNLKRILMYDEFSGHPLRKDYPVNKRQPLIGPVN